MADDLKTHKVVLFGAGGNAVQILTKLQVIGITPAYFVDNNRNITQMNLPPSFVGGGVVVNSPEILIDEDKSILKIIITPLEPYYSAIESQIIEMGMGECIWKNWETIYEDAIESLYKDFCENFVPEKLPELKLYKPKYPFGEMAVIIGLSKEKFVDFAKREEFKLRNLPQFSSCGGGCVISTFSPKLDKNSDVYIFSGNAFFNGKFLFGTDDIGTDIEIKSLRESIGEFELLVIDKGGIELGNDFFGFGKWFYYHKNGIFAAATSYHMLLLLLKEAGEKLTTNSKYAAMNLAICNRFTLTSFSEECEIKNVFILPPDKKILVKSNESIEFQNTRFFQEANYPEDYDETKYEQLLHKAKKELIQNATAIFSHPKFEYITMDITDGLDSRLSLAAALNLPKILRKKLRIHCNPNRVPEDLKTAIGISNMFDLEWRSNIKCEKKIIPQTDGICQSQISFNLGTYFDNHIMPPIIQHSYPNTIRLNGGNGECCAGISQATEEMIYNHKMSFREFLDILPPRNKYEIHCETYENFVELMQHNFNKFTNDNTACAFDIFHQLFHNRLHFKNKYKGLEFPEDACFSLIQSLSAYKAKKMNLQKSFSHAFIFDLTKTLHPLLGNFPHLEEHQKKRLEFINNNGLNYYPVGKFEILPDYSRMRYEESLLNAKTNCLPNKESFDASLAEVKNKKEGLYTWLYHSQEALLSCLKTIIDNSPELSDIGATYFKCIRNQNYAVLCELSKHCLKNPMAQIWKNKLLSLYYQIQITKGED